MNKLLNMPQEVFKMSNTNIGTLRDFFNTRIKIGSYVITICGNGYGLEIFKVIDINFNEILNKHVLELQYMSSNRCYMGAVDPLTVIVLSKKQITFHAIVSNGIYTSLDMERCMSNDQLTDFLGVPIELGQYVSTHTLTGGHPRLSIGKVNNIRYVKSPVPTTINPALSIKNFYETTVYTSIIRHPKCVIALSNKQIKYHVTN